LGVGSAIKANLNCAMVPIDPSAWMPIAYFAAADECVELFREAVDAEHPVLDGKRQRSCVRRGHRDGS
jgi:hypothetical protein